MQYFRNYKHNLKINKKNNLLEIRLFESSSSKELKLGND